MNVYLDIKLIPGSEVSLNFLWKRLYTQVHLAFVNCVGKSFAVAFPNYSAEKFTLGRTLRVFGVSACSFEELRLDDFFQGLTDYIRVSKVQKIPKNISHYENYCRIQTKSRNRLVRLAKRRAKRENIPFEKALERYKKNKIEQSKLPYIYMSSLSNGHQYRLFIQKQQSTVAVENGEIDTFGLTKELYLPAF